jgi:outer membrane protein OmpA-like peptidoglycan-associated protein
MRAPYIRVFVFLWSVVYGLSSFSQTVSQLINAGDKKIADGDYYAASQYFKDALKKDEENIELNFKYAEACRMFSDLNGADYGYREVIKLDKSNQYPMAYFWLGEVLRSNCECKCEEAQKLFHRFQTKYRKKDYYYARAQQEIESCSWVRDHLQQNDSIKIEHLGDEVNTPQSEFNAIHVFPDKLQYSALRNISSDKKNEKYLVRLYNQPPNPEAVFMPNGAKAELNIGNGAYSPDSRKFFFTQCEQKDKSATRCDIYVSKYENYKWTSAEKLSDHVNNPAASNTQPSQGYDLSGNEVLFFSSDREGGQGNMDIWISKLNADGTYQQAVNAGATINTPGNEVTPFYDVNNKKLFFSSDWHYGFGGFDIFETKGESTTWTVPQNLLQPINTAQNDLYYSVAVDNSRAYITSNRKGSYFITAETCCNDIYAYNTGKKIQRGPVAKAETAVVTARKDSAITAAVLRDSISIVQTGRVIEPRKVVEDRLKRIREVIPVLYFHNDKPNAKTLSDTTKLDYKETYEAYSALRNEYIREFSRPLKKEDKPEAEKEIKTFFDEKVDQGFYNLIAFSSQLLSLLQDGNTVEITIKGYCSPLNYNKYNINLGYRRVASLRNYFFHYRDGILLPYVQSGKLILKTVSFGEETAAKNISDSRIDVRNSVYSPAAALERRVEVISVELK